MKVTIDSLLLNKALKKIQPAISTNRILPILEYVCFDVVENSICVTATNLNLVIKSYMNCTADKNVKFLLPFKRIFDISSVLNEPLTVVIGEDIKIKYSTGIYEIGKPSDSKHFPSTETISKDFEVPVSNDFLYHLQLSKQFLSRDINDLIFSNAFFEIKKDLVRVTTADRSAYLFRYSEEAESKKEYSCLFDISFINALNNIGEGIIYGNQKWICFENLHTTVMCLLSEQKYPDCDKVFDKPETNCRVSKSDLLSALNEMMVYEDSFYFFSMKFSKDTISLNYDNNVLEDHFEVTRNARHSVTTSQIQFNGKHFKTVLSSISESEDIEITFQDEKNNAFVQGDNKNLNLIIRPVKF